MGKTKDEIIQLEINWDEAYKKYQKDANEIDKFISENADNFLSAMHSINGKRLDISDQIIVLHACLKKYDNYLKVGKEVLPRDYRNETPKSYNKPAFAENRNPHNFPYDSRSLFEKFTDYEMGRSNYGILKMKRMLPEEYATYNEDLEIWKKDLADRSDILRFYKLASKIANLYLETIMTIQYTIQKVMIPELYGIESFLYACGIAECIIEESNPAFAHKADITEFNSSNSPYYHHFVFVLNASDFYKEMKAIFCKPIITNLLNRKTPTESDIRDFERTAKSIENKKCMLEKSVEFRRVKPCTICLRIYQKQLKLKKLCLRIGIWNT